MKERWTFLTVISGKPSRIPRVFHCRGISCFEGCTPFCVAMKACLNYIGQQIDYSYIMAVTGAAFRLRWNLNCWDDGNVDIMNIYEDRYEAFRRAFCGAGRSLFRYFCKHMK